MSLIDIIPCFFDIFAFFIFLNFTLKPLLLNEILTFIPIIPIFGLYFTFGISIYSFIPKLKLFIEMLFGFIVKLTASNNLVNNIY